MKRTSLIQLGGLAAMVGSAAYATLGLVEWVRWQWYLNLPKVIELSYWDLEPLFLLGVIATLAALHLLQRERYSLLGTLAFLAAFVGVAMILVAELSTFISLEAPHYWSLFLYGLLVATVGIIVYGVLTIGAGARPWWCGAALIVGSPFSGFFLYLSGDLEWLLGVPWILAGYAVFRAGTHQPQQPSRVR